MLRVVEFPDGSRLIVDAEERAEAGDQEDLAGQVLPSTPDNLPEGVETVSTGTAARRAAELLDAQIAGLGALARAAVTSAQPSEIEIQAHVKFASDTNLIPFLVKAQGEGGLRLTLKWKAAGAAPEQGPENDVPAG